MIKFDDRSECPYHDEVFGCLDCYIEKCPYYEESEEKDMINMNDDIIHRDIFDPTLNERIKEVEKALGFRLFFWQKTFIKTGQFRCFGKTTAEILKELMDLDAEPLDLIKKPSNRMASIYRDNLRDIWDKLHLAGVPMRTVFWNKRDKGKYYNDIVMKKEKEKANDQI